MRLGIKIGWVAALIGASILTTARADILTLTSGREIKGIIEDAKPDSTHVKFIGADFTQSIPRSRIQSIKKEPLALDPPPGQRRVGARKAGATVATFRSKSVAPQGWGYSGKATPHGSMTVGAIGGLCILDYMLGKDWRKDDDVLEGLQWLNKNWSVTENPKKGAQWYMYYIYAIERAGMLFGTETIGDHKWYREGAEQLLSAQSGGGWGNVVDTCFAILFLRRATRPLNVATGGGRR